MNKQDFPQLAQNITYLDSGATAPKPQAVIDAMVDFIKTDYANVHRGIYGIGARATEKYSAARARVAAFVGAEADDVVFTKGATEAINLVAASWGRTNLKAGDEIILTALEHHANIVPWQMVAAEKGAIIKVVPIEANGDIKVASFEALITPRTKLIACAHVSNVLGTVLPVADICALARKHSIVTLIDGCQAVAHRPVDVKAMGCDFYVFSAHKLYGPSGIGALVGRADVLNAMPPYQGGGDMIMNVRWSGTTYRAAPHKFEAGTPPIIEAIGFAAALDYIDGTGFDKIYALESDLLDYATKALLKIPGLTIYGDAPDKEGIISFTIAGVPPYDLTTIADQMGVCLRVGQHCAEPLHDALGVAATARISLALFNTTEDIDRLLAAIHKARELLKCA